MSLYKCTYVCIDMYICVCVSKDIFLEIDWFVLLHKVHIYCRSSSSSNIRTNYYNNTSVSQDSVYFQLLVIVYWGHRLVSQLLYCLKWHCERQMDRQTWHYFKTGFENGIFSFVICICSLSVVEIVLCVCVCAILTNIEFCTGYIEFCRALYIFIYKYIMYVVVHDTHTQVGWITG